MGPLVPWGELEWPQRAWGGIGMAAQTPRPGLVWPHRPWAEIGMAAQVLGRDWNGHTGPRAQGPTFSRPAGTRYYIVVWTTNSIFPHNLSKIVKTKVEIEVVGLPMARSVSKFCQFPCVECQKRSYGDPIGDKKV